MMTMMRMMMTMVMMLMIMMMMVNDHLLQGKMAILDVEPQALKILRSAE